MAEGWIKVHRSLLDWEWYGKPEMVQLFIHLLLRANYTASAWRGVEVERGQLITSKQKLSQETGLSIQQIKTCLKKLKATGEITSQATNSYTKITLCNYESCQDEEQPTNQQSNQQTNHQSTINQPSINHQSTTSKEGKKGKKKKKGKNSARARGECGTLLTEEEMGELRGPWLHYLDYRGREKKGKFKSAQTERKALKNLHELSGGDEKVAQKIVEQSEQRTWTGLFPLKDQKYGKTSQEKYRGFLTGNG